MLTCVVQLCGRGSVGCVWDGVCCCAPQEAGSRAFRVMPTTTWNCIIISIEGRQPYWKKPLALFADQDRFRKDRRQGAFRTPWPFHIPHLPLKAWRLKDLSHTQTAHYCYYSVSRATHTLTSTGTEKYGSKQARTTQAIKLHTNQVCHSIS